MEGVLWIIDHYSSEPKYGGYTRQYNLAKGIAESGIKVIVIASTFSHFKHTYISEKNCYISKVDPNVLYVYLRTDKYENNAGASRLRGMFSFMKMVSEYSDKIAGLFGKPNWIVASSPHIFSWKIGEIMAKKYKADFSIEIRDFWPLELRSKTDSIVRKVLYAYFDVLETHSFKAAKHIIGTMPYGNLYFDDYKKPDKKKFVFIGQPLDCENFDQMADKNWNIIPENIRSFVSDEFYCVFAGYYMKYEGVYEMLEAARQLRDIKFVFVGSGSEEEGMRSFVKKYSLDNVYIGGRIEKESIPALLRRSSVCMAYLHDSDNPDMFKYGLSKNKLNEYMYSGAVTVMGYDFKNNEIQDSNSGYTFSPACNKFAEYIRKIKEMSIGDRNKLGENGRNYIIAEHNVESLAHKYIEEVLMH